MKRKIIPILIFILFIIILKTKVYAESEVNFTLYRFHTSSALNAFADTDEYKNTVLPLLQNTFGLEGNTIKEGKEVMKFNTKITAKEISGLLALGNKYEITIGTGDNAITEKVKDETSLAKYGYNGTNMEWTVVLLGGAESVERGGNNTRYQFEVKATKLYTQSEAEEQDVQEKDGNEIENRDVTTPSDVIENAQNAFNFVDNFLKNPAGTLFTVLFDGLLRIIDVIQMAANFFETIPLKTSADYTVVYEYNYLKKDGNASVSSNVDAGAGHRNMYTEVSAGYTKDGKSSWQTQKPINIDIEDANTNENEYGFSSSTLIPVIPVDVFTIAKGNIAIFDPNFLIIDTNIHTNSDSIWFTIRKVVTIAIRGLIYITAAILVVGLIWHGINLIWGTITPNQRRDHINGIHTFATSLLLLIGTLIIIALGIYVNKMFSSYNNIDQGTVELPIRVNVKEADYSFSTTQTGAIRYLAQIQNPNLVGRKIMYTIEYLILAIINLIVALFFLARMILMMIGAGYGIVAVGVRIIGQENLLPIDYQHWLIWYLALAMCQTILVFAYTIANSIS